MKKAWHIAAKDMQVWLRDISALGVLLAMPVVLILILGSAFGGATEAQIPVGVVNLDEGADGGQPGAARTELGDELVELMDDSEQLNKAFGIKALSETDARKQVATGDLVGVLVIPKDFSADVMGGEPAQLLVIKDPGSQLSADIWESVVLSFASEYSAASIGVQTAIASAEGVRPDLTTPSGAGFLTAAAVQRINQAPDGIRVEDAEADNANQIEPLDYYAISMSAMFLMFGAMFGAFSTIKERREQTLSRLLATPTSGAQVVGGKMLGIFALGMVQFTVLYVFTRFVFGVYWGRDVIAIFAVAAAEMLAVTGFAVLVASLAKSERGAGGIAPLVIQVQALLGGAFFAITILPEWLQPIRYTSVIGWALAGWQTIQLDGGGLSDVLGPIAAMLGFAAVLFAVGTMLTKART